MYRFFLYSLVLHIIIIITLLVFASFEPAPKKVQIKLLSLPKNNDTKKTPPSKSIPLVSPVVEKKIETKKESPKVKEKKSQEVNKLLEEVLQQNLKEKTIEKAITKKEVLVQNTNKPSNIKKTQTTPKKDIIPAPKLEVKEAPSIINSDNSFSNPYSNPVLPQDNKKVEDNPYDNPVIYEEIPQIKIPTLPEKQIPTIPIRKEIDVSMAKEDNLDVVLQSISNTNNDIMSEESLYLTENDKKALMNQMSQCLATLGYIREKDESVILLIEMQENAKIKDINVIRNNEIIHKGSLSNLESRIIYLFNSQKCSKLILPEGKFKYWQKFTIKLNLKGLFQ